MSSRRFTESAAVLTALGALVVLYVFSYGFAPRIDRGLHRAIGKALAVEALNLAGRGGQITVISRDTEAFPQPAIDALLASFLREVRRGGASIAAIQLLQADPLRPVGVPPGDFFELIRRAPPQQVIVSLLGPPLLTEEQRYSLGQVRPKIVAFCSGPLVENVDLSQLFKAGLLHAAVASRRVSTLAAQQRSPSQGGFEQLYLIVRAANLSALSAPSATAPK